MISQISHIAAFLRRTAGLVRSLVTYRHPFRQARLRRLYSPFVKPGDRVFDIGAHLGDRTRAFASLGGQVVAFEPQPHLMVWLQRLEGERRASLLAYRGPRRNGRVAFRAEAVGAEPGMAQLAISQANPTVSTLADSWRQGIGAANETFSHVRWEEQVEVPVVTLDQMITEYGLPAFCKIDVEGFEEAVLAGLSQPLPALSFEFVAGTLERAENCVRRLEFLSADRPYEFNVVLGEGREFLLARWQSGEEILAWLESSAGQFSSGDIYARLR